MSSWSDLQAELDMWAAEKRWATFWWRDDDLNEVTPAFERLLHLRESLDIPLTLAVIPDNVDPHIADDLEGCHLVQHGVFHQINSLEGEKKSEFPESRDLEEAKSDLLLGKQRLETLFGDEFLPIFVPPWNRIAPSLAVELGALGYHGLSRYKAREEAVISGVAVINTHVDPVNWRGDRSALPEGEILQQVVDHLQARRLGQVDANEPTGYLSHHLMFDEALWEITYKLLSTLNSHKIVRWLTFPGAMSLIDQLPEGDLL